MVTMDTTAWRGGRERRREEGREEEGREEGGKEGGREREGGKKGCPLTICCITVGYH